MLGGRRPAITEVGAFNICTHTHTRIRGRALGNTADGANAFCTNGETKPCIQASERLTHVSTATL